MNILKFIYKDIYLKMAKNCLNRKKKSNLIMAKIKNFKIVME